MFLQNRQSSPTVSNSPQESQPPSRALEGDPVPPQGAWPAVSAALSSPPLPPYRDQERHGVTWRISDGLVPYPAALAAMEARVAAIRAGQASELVWLLEHPPLLTAGTSAQESELLHPERFPVYRSGRGGRFTYHGPGQRVAYVMLDLSRRGADIRRYIHSLEDWLIATLWRFHIRGERREGRVGIWVDRGPVRLPDGRTGRQEDKIAAIGVRVRRWVAFHGVALNVEPDLSHFDSIIPCGLEPLGADGSRLGVTSLVDLGLPITLPDVDLALLDSFPEVFSLPAPPEQP